MNSDVEDLYKKIAHFHDKFHDPELDDYLLHLGGKLQDAETVYHHLGYLFMNIRATIAHAVRPKHLQYAMDRADHALALWRADEKKTVSA